MIRDALAQDIQEGVLGPGDRLPTEPQLAARFAAGRHSVRRAVEALAKEGKLSIEQGRGTFVEETPRLTYSIGKRTRLRKNLIPQGCTVTGDLLGADLIDPPDDIRSALHLSSGAKVVQSQRITLANGLPVAFGSVYHSAERFPDFVQRRDLLGSTTETYKSFGIMDYIRGETRMHGRPARPHEAKMLKQHPDLPVIVIRAIDTELDGTPLSVSRVVWAAGRVTFTMSGFDDDS